MDRQNISENLSSWIRAISGAIGVLLLFAFVMWNNENEKNTILTQETKTNQMRNAASLFPDEAKSRNNQDAVKNSTLTQQTKTNETLKAENLSTDEAESIKNQEAEILTIRY